MSNIYVMKYNVSLVVQAESMADAEDLVHSAWGQAGYLDVLDPQFRSLDRIHCITELPDGWNGKCVPIFGDGNTLLEEILPEVKEE